MGRSLATRAVLAVSVVVIIGACAPTTGPGATGQPTAILTAPEDGAVVTSPVDVDMTAANVDIVEAGEVVAGEAHFHLMVDVPCADEGEVITANDDHLDYGDGSTTDRLELEPGEHALCLQLGDGEHHAVGVPDEATITVEE